VLCAGSVRIRLGNELLAYTGDEGMTVAIRQRAHELIEALPDDATWQDLLYAVDLRADAEAGLADAKAGRLTEAKELRRDLSALNL
jgi:predicted transcriptional regulator